MLFYNIYYLEKFFIDQENQDRNYRNNQNQPVYITRSMIEKFRKEMEQIFIGENIQEKRDFLKKFIEKIIIKDKEIEIIYYAPGTKFPFSDLPDA